MSKVTSKLQVTVPKAIADRFHIRPGDEIEWIDAGDGIRVVLTRGAMPLTVERRLELFDASTRRQRARERGRHLQPSRDGRGWSREELYGRGSAR